MIGCFNIEMLPKVKKIYSVTRKTVWQIADPYHILLFIKEGSCIIDLDGEEHMLKKGDVFFIPKNRLYTRKPAEDNLCTIIYVHFECDSSEISAEDAQRKISSAYGEIDEKMLKNEYFGIENKQLLIIQHLETKEKQQNIDRLLNISSELTKANGFYLSAELSCCFFEIMLLCAEISLAKLVSPHRFFSERRIPSNLQGAVQFIRQHYSEKIGLEDLCRECAVSKQQMIRYFRGYFAITPNEYITRFKVNKARELLMNARQMSIKEISTELGYDDQCYFSRVFTKSTGESPKEFRDRVTNFNVKKHIEENKK